MVTTPLRTLSSRRCDMPTLEVYSRDWCPYCAKAKALLKSG
ncbi:MAG: glutaredoxin [Deltaproteobacteria bacterium]|nr:glutaredoxin [Deltaproteobacteria bacterium]